MPVAVKLINALALDRGQPARLLHALRIPLDFILDAVAERCVPFLPLRLFSGPGCWIGPKLSILSIALGQESLPAVSFDSLVEKLGERFAGQLGHPFQLGVRGGVNLDRFAVHGNSAVLRSRSHA